MSLDSTWAARSTTCGMPALVTPQTIDLAAQLEPPDTFDDLDAEDDEAGADWALWVSVSCSDTCPLRYTESDSYNMLSGCKTSSKTRTDLWVRC